MLVSFYWQLFVVKVTQNTLMILFVPNLLLLTRVHVKVFPASTVEPAKHFTRLTTTDVLAQKTTPAETVRMSKVRYLSLSVNFTSNRLILQDKKVNWKKYILPVALDRSPGVNIEIFVSLMHCPAIELDLQTEIAKFFFCLSVRWYRADCLLVWLSDCCCCCYVFLGYRMYTNYFNVKNVK